MRSYILLDLYLDINKYIKIFIIKSLDKKELQGKRVQQIIYSINLNNFNLGFPEGMSLYFWAIFWVLLSYIIVIFVGFILLLVFPDTNLNT